MRALTLLPLLALAACSGENQGWNPNYRAEATSYGNYLRAREDALTGERAEPPRVIPVALPARAPTAKEIAGPSPVQVVERETTAAAARAGIVSNRKQLSKARAPAIDTAPAVAYPVRTAPAADVVPTTVPVIAAPVTTSVLPSAPPTLVQYARASLHRPGTRLFARDGSVRGDCAAFASAAAAQQAFLTAGGPQRDALGLDPDGDGYVCGWEPAAYRDEPL